MFLDGGQILTLVGDASNGHAVPRGPEALGGAEGAAGLRRRRQGSDQPGRCYDARTFARYATGL